MISYSLFIAVTVNLLSLVVANQISVASTSGVRSEAKETSISKPDNDAGSSSKYGSEIRQRGQNGVSRMSGVVDADGGIVMGHAARKQEEEELNQKRVMRTKLNVVVNYDGQNSLGGNFRQAQFNDNFFIGSQALVAPAWQPYRVSPFAGHEFSEHGYDMLTEMREAVATSNMNQFKFKLAANTCESYRLNCAGQDNGLTLSTLAQQPEVASTLSDPRFKWYHIWTYSFNMPSPLARNFNKQELAAEYQETYDLASHLLQTFQGTGKAFFLGAWEGDWALMWASGCRNGNTYDMSCHPTEEVINRYIVWSQNRQRAVDDAKAAVGATGVDVFHYIEFNFAQENFQGGNSRPSILNSVVPVVNPDFLSFSSYKSTNRYVNHEGRWFNQGRVDHLFWEVLDYAETKLGQTDTDFSIMGGNTKRIFIGEFGPTNVDPRLARTTLAEVIRASLEWGCPFVLQWMIYDNDTTVPLVPRETTDLASDLTPMRQLYRDWKAAATEFVSGGSRSSEELRHFAVQWFTQIQEQNL